MAYSFENFNGTIDCYECSKRFEFICRIRNKMQLIDFWSQTDNSGLIPSTITIAQLYGYNVFYWNKSLSYSTGGYKCRPMYLQIEGDDTATIGYKMVMHDEVYGVVGMRELEKTIELIENGV